MAWEERIELNPDVLAGQPVVKGTRLAVAFVVELLADGWSEEAVLREYPGLTRDDVQACLRYASARLQAEQVYPLQA
jgi:uncharacterized protein (DUF433 family)